MGDFSFRAIESLKKCDLILCEDTRHSRPLLQKFEIDSPLLSFHQFNESSRLASVLEKLKNGADIGLISDAGTPLISDPGMDLIRVAAEQNIPLTAVPGACSPIVALTISGFDTSLFQFSGFLPKKEKELSSRLIEILCYRGTTICFESPKRIRKTLETIKHVAPARKVCVVRELTKKFEERICGSAAECLEKLDKEVKGEIVLLIEGERDNPLLSEKDIVKSVEYLEKTFSLTKQEAIKTAATLSPLSKRDIYEKIHGLSS